MTPPVVTNTQQPEVEKQKFSIQSQKGTDLTGKYITSDVLDRKLREEIDKANNNIISNFVAVLGIFASIVTFLLIEVQILKEVCDFSKIMGFSAFILGGLVTFITLLLVIINFKDVSKKTFLITLPVTIVAVVLFTVAYIFMKNGTDEYTCKVEHLNNKLELLQIKLEDKSSNQYEDINRRLNNIENSMKE